MSFDDLTALMDQQVTDRLGDSMIYQPVSNPGQELTVKGFIRNADEPMGMGGHAAVVPDIEIMVRKADIELPERNDMIVLSKRNEVVKVHTWYLDDSGFWWNLKVKRH